MSGCCYAVRTGLRVLSSLCLLCVCHVRTRLLKPYQIVFVIHAGLFLENIHASRRMEMYD